MRTCGQQKRVSRRLLTLIDVDFFARSSPEAIVARTSSPPPLFSSGKVGRGCCCYLRDSVPLRARCLCVPFDDHDPLNRGPHDRDRASITARRVGYAYFLAWAGSGYTSKLCGYVCQTIGGQFFLSPPTGQFNEVLDLRAKDTSVFERVMMR